MRHFVSGTRWFGSGASVLKYCEFFPFFPSGSKRPLHSHSHPSLGCSGTKPLCEVFTSDVFHLLLCTGTKPSLPHFPLSVFCFEHGNDRCRFFLQAVCRKGKLFTCTTSIAQHFLWGGGKDSDFFFFTLFYGFFLDMIRAFFSRMNTLLYRKRHT